MLKSSTALLAASPSLLTESNSLTEPLSSSNNTQVDLRKSLLFAAIENFADGLLIVTKTGEILHRNRCAQQLLKQPGQTLKALPKRIWQTCQTLLHTDDAFDDARVVLEDEIRVAAADQCQSKIRVRVQWFNAEAQDCFLVMLEDCVRSAEYFAQNDAHRYHLTPREAEVWQLKRADYTYKAIAQKLYISENTVKKHLKNVYAKREQFA
ncbi:MAG: LuxR C-terminal-related transcriptional regulator [Cyanobacteria bacterium J06607_6]